MQVSFFWGLKSEPELCPKSPPSPLWFRSGCLREIVFISPLIPPASLETEVASVSLVVSLMRITRQYIRVLYMHTFSLLVMLFSLFYSQMGENKANMILLDIHFWVLLWGPTEMFCDHTYTKGAFGGFSIYELQGSAQSLTSYTQKQSTCSHFYSIGKHSEAIWFLTFLF